MAKPNFPEKQTAWGTWEELLLASAVHRYGADSWDSVASELRKRSSTPYLLSPLSCKHKYLDLKRRFSQTAVVSSVAAADGVAGVTSIPFLDELRRLRVAELRREVERYDLSIVSLESKVEKLKEEREQGLKEREEKADLEKKDAETEPENASPENIAEKAASGEGSVHDARSVDESNSTNLKDDVAETGGAAIGKEPEPSEPAGGEPDRATECGKPVVEDSYDGSSETIAKGSAAVSPVRESEKVNSEKDGSGDGGGGGDSAESKGVEEGTKEACSSGMQSSTSLSRKNREEPDEPDAEDQSVATKRTHHVESKTLADFLEILRSHKSGSFFERRLDIQETPNYINMIRQHIDFEMVRIRLEEGWYSACKSKFFRDVLLALNNAIVFFGSKSRESRAALELRSLVLKEMAQRTTKQDSLPKEEARVPKPELEEGEQPSDILLRKPKLSVPMNACRKRSSITARAASTSSSGPEKKKEQTSALLDVKPAMSWKQSDKTSDTAEEFPGTKKKRKERFRAGTKNNSNKSSASRSNAENNKNSGANSNTGPSTRAGTSNENSASKSDKKNNSSNASGKKQSAANFLNRMKRSSSSNNGSLLETLKESENSRGRAEQKKNGGNKGNNNKQKEQASSRRASAGKQAKEQESPAKRTVGRPLKRPATAAAAAVPAKRIRQSVEKEATASRNAKKRSRK